jgi:hypothetical protein
MAGSGFAQNSGQSVPDGVTELSPPVRPGRRGGVYVTGSTNPFSLGLSNGATANAVGGFGAGVRTNSGSGASRATIVTNNGVVTTNYIAVSSEAAEPVSPAVPQIVYPGVPIVPSGGVNVHATTPNGSATTAAGPPAAQNPGVVTPPPPALAPSGTAIAPQGTPTAPPPGSAPRGTPSPPPPLR